MKINLLVLVALIVGFACSFQKNKEPKATQGIEIHSEFKSYFEECGVQGTIVIFDQNKQKWLISDSTFAHTAHLPASTFKIINLLIALETQTIKNEHQVVKWVGKTDTVKYGYRPEIYRDMSVKEAFEVSAGWVFMELAKKIGKEEYRKYLKACNYGNLKISEDSDDFWNFGDFAISPVNQVEFLRGLYAETLPFSKRNMRIAKKVMLAEKNKTHTIRAKTGWTRENNTNTGWWVGYIETKENTYFFATLLLQDRKNKRDDFGSCRKEITKRVFSDLGFLKSKKKSLAAGNPLFLAVDHAPIVVNDLESIQNMLKQDLNFTVKDGKAHEGIQNCFIKFGDGTYLEFIQPLDSLAAIGKYYSNFLKTRQGGATFAISVSNTEQLKDQLNQKNIPFAYDQNKIWQTVEPVSEDFFFIEYANKSWKDTPSNWTHLNTAKGLSAVYILSKNFQADLKKYLLLGFIEKEKGKIFETPYRKLKVGQNEVILLDANKSKNKNSLLNLNNITGICGFNIRVNSLQMFNQSLKQKLSLEIEKNRTVVYLSSYNLFFIFEE